MTRQAQSSESVSEAVVKAVSEAEDCPSNSLPPLYNAVNPKALERVFTVTNSDASDRSGHITFEYSESVVTIGKNGYLEVQESLKLLDSEEFYGYSSTITEEIKRD